MRVARLASQADLCYNEATHIVVPGGATNAPGRIHSWRNVPMTTLPPHVPDGNLIPATSGIYKITCTANKRIYIGSAVNLRERKRAHFSALRHNRHGNQHLQRAWNKYGEQAFTFEVLEQVLPIALTAREQYWLNKLKPFDRKGFNIAREAGSTLGVEMSPETRAKISQANLGYKHTPESSERKRQAMLGNKHGIGKNLGNKHALGHSHPQTPETREKIRQGHLGKKNTLEHNEKVRQANLGKKLSPEHRAKIGQAHLGSKRSLETRERIRQGNLNRSPEARAKAIEASRQANLGRKHTPEQIEKNRQAQLNRSPESNEKFSQVNLGRKHTTEARANMGRSHLGYKHTPEAIERMRQSQASPELRERKRQASLGRKMSPETIAKRSATRTGMRYRKKEQ